MSNRQPDCGGYRIGLLVEYVIVFVLNASINKHIYMYLLVSNRTHKYTFDMICKMYINLN